MRNKDSMIYGDGPLDEFPLGQVCQINPPEDPSNRGGYDWMEFDLDELIARIKKFEGTTDEEEER